MTDKSDASKWVTYPARGAVGIVVCAAIFIAGRSFEVPGATEFWDLAAQPLATAVAGAGAIAAGLLALHNGAKTRSLDAAHHVDTMNRNQVSDFRGRYTTAANQIADTESAAIREAGIYAIGALADDWISYGDETGQWELARSQAQACINLLCSYLRANRYNTGDVPTTEDQSMKFTAEETSVRASVVGVLREQTPRWRAVEMKWILAGKAPLTVISLDLSGASLESAQLSGADLLGVKLIKTDLRRANLSHAKLMSANMQKTNLTRARLNNANLSRTTLDRTNFTAAVLAGATLRDARMFWTILRQTQLHGTDLAGVSGLDTASMNEGTRFNPDTEWPQDFVPDKGTLILPEDETPADFVLPFGDGVKESHDAAQDSN